MKKHHSFNINEIENMYPYERNVYYDFIRGELQEKAQSSQNEKHVFTDPKDVPW
jgi:hypothetical protein